MEPHEEFLELCALSTSGDLTEEEQKKLQGHLSECRECRKALEEFEAAVDVGIPLLSSKLVGAAGGQSGSSDARPVESQWLRTPTFDGAPVQGNGPSDGGKRAFAFAHRNGRGATHVNWNSVWLPFAACILLGVALAMYTYRVGRSRPLEVASTSSSKNASEVAEALERQISDVDHARHVLAGQLGERDRVIAELRRRIEQQSSSLEQMKTAQANLEQSIEVEEAEKQQADGDRASLAQKLDATEASVQKMQAELENARQQQSAGGAQDASLRAQIVDLNGQLREREATIDKQEDLLSHDRDIRDLMGARDLYIAEVYDVGRDGATQKPCGRVFYTKGKSLVFYAYDLDQQPGVRNARTFQAWGRRGADMQEALNLGVFYEDNAAKKRWVLKFDDAKTLEQIDAVFVTVEPNGGSHKPSGKPLLFAYLKIDPNHP
jgi:DNA repair exonuclease SbcCD ATPase subunit